MAKLIRYGLLLCIYMVICSKGYSNKIDSLLTNEDVSKFLTDNFSKNRLSYTPDTDVTLFYKSDIDSNGLTDLLVKTDICFAVLDNGTGQYDLHHIFARGRESFDLIEVFNVNGSPVLVVRGWYYDNIITGSKSWLDDTLIFKFGDFIEYNVYPSTEDVEEINFKIGNGWPGRIWDLRIDAGGWVTFEMDHGARIFTGAIDSITLNTLVQTINYINLPELLERESRKMPASSNMATDLETFSLEVKFKNGQIARTDDYGGEGTYGLQNLYRQLFNIAENLNELH